MLPRANGGVQMGILGWVFLAVLVLLIVFGISIYNRLVRLRALVKEGFSGITVQLRRRADLIAMRQPPAMPGSRRTGRSR